MSPPSPADDAHGSNGGGSPRGSQPTDSELQADESEDDRTSIDESPPQTTSESVRRTLDRHLPEAGVDSRWWYGVAAVPAYFLVTLVGGIVAFGLFAVAGILDVTGFGGVASFSTFVLVAGVATVFGVVGIAVAIVFPIALYVDARAIERLDGEWTPDPVLWCLFAVVGVLVTNFVVSVPLALYYLYRRHEAVGTP